MLGTYSYHEIFKKTVIGFGTLFNNIELRRTSGSKTEVMKVPLAYGPKQKFLARLAQLGDLTTKDRTQITLPRISFEIGAIQYDPTRKLSPTSYIRHTSGDKTNKGFMPIPYNVNFELAILSKNQDDALQIVEQILPYFTPEFTLTINFTDNFNTKIDVPIVLNSVSPEFEFEGDTSTQRNVIFNLSFTALSYVFSPIKTNKIIRKTDVTTFISGFNTDGSITGPTGAIARTISSITGPSGASSMPPNASVTTENFEFGSVTGGLSITGATLS